MSARSMMRVLAFGMSRPDSTIVVATSTSDFRSQKSTMIFSSSCSFICPCATRDPGLRHQLRRRSAATLRIEVTRLCTKKTWPSRSSSRRMAAATCLSS